MDLAALVGLTVRASILLIVFSLGLRATQEDALYLFRQPRHLVRSLLSMNVVMPLVAVGIAIAFDLGWPVEVTLIALAISPVPPILPKKELKAGGRASYAVGLLVAAGPAGDRLRARSPSRILGWFFAKETHMPASAVARLVAITVLLPLSAGLVVSRLAPALAERMAGPISRGATVLLAVVAVLLVVKAWPAAMALIGSGRVLAIATFVVIGLGVGHWLGGPDPRTGPCSRCRPRPDTPGSRWRSPPATSRRRTS